MCFCRVQGTLAAFAPLEYASSLLCTYAKPRLYMPKQLLPVCESLVFGGGCFYENLAALETSVAYTPPVNRKPCSAFGGGTAYSSPPYSLANSAPSYT